DERYPLIVGQLCEIPVGPKQHRRLIPIITDDYPDPEFGSGAVKITGAHDFNDYGVAKRGGIPCYRLMDTQAGMRADGAPYAEAAAMAQSIIEGAKMSEAEIDAINLVPDEYRGMDRVDARKAVVEAISSEGLAVMTTAGDPRLGKKKVDPEEADKPVPLVEAKKIMQPFGDRSKVVIEPMLTDQWFVDAETLAKPALASVKEGRTNFAPDNWKSTYFHWLENIEPWCISRQLWWGHQIPVWYDADGEMYCAMSEEEAVRKSGGKALTRDPDVLDTWFSSALWPYSTLGWPEKTPELEKYYQTDVLITGNDIIFFWVARMMMTGLEFMGEEPFHTVYINSIVTDAKGKKMSKSVGNVIDPLELIDEYGADATRFTLASQESQARRQLRLSVDTVAGGRNFGTKIWNAARFAEMNECAYGGDFDPSKVKETVNRWIIGETARARIAFDEALAQYRFNDAANGLYAHTWRVFCDWYVEFSKPLLQGDGPAKAETQATMAWALDQILILLHPIMPFITEELWSLTGTRAKPLIHADWPTYGAELEDAAAKAEMDWVIGLIEQVRSVRMEMGVKPGAVLPMVIAEIDDTAQGRLDRNRALVERMARIEDINEGTVEPGSVTLTLDGAVMALPLAGVIDVAAERARLEKAAGKVAKELGQLKGKLSNEKFLANAKPEVIEEQRERLAAAEAEDAKLSTALGRLAEIG
ncbi:MAG: valine--tRNA ligase, partial [Pseudomonadota bacterium]